MFRAKNLPILRSTFDCMYSFWFNAPTLMPNGATVEMELSTVAPVGSSVGTLYQKAVHTVKSAPEDGQNFRPKHVGLN